MTAAQPTGKVLLVSHYFPPDQWGGLAKLVFRVARHCLALGLETHVAQLVFSDDPLILLDENRTTELRDGLIVHRLRLGREAGPAEPGLFDGPHDLTLRQLHQSLRLLEAQENFDLLVGFFLYPIGYLTSLLARRLGLPSILVVVGDDVHKYTLSPEKVGFCRAGLELADRVVAVSQELIEAAQALTPVRDKARLILSSIEPPERVWTPRRRAGQPFRIGSAGIFKYAKGLPYLFKAAASLRPNYNFTIELLGQLRPAERPVFEAMVSRTGLSDLVRFQESLPDEAVPDWLRGLDIYVLPSLSEGCPQVVLEALAAGVPTVATRVGAVEELIEDGVSGRLADWGSSESLARALAAVLDAPDAGLSLGRAGRRRMEELFSPERERRAWQALLAELL